MNSTKNINKALIIILGLAALSCNRAGSQHSSLRTSEGTNYSAQVQLDPDNRGQGRAQRGLALLEGKSAVVLIQGATFSEEKSVTFAANGTSSVSFTTTDTGPFLAIVKKIVIADDGVESPYSAPSEAPADWALGKRLHFVDYDLYVASQLGAVQASGSVGTAGFRLVRKDSSSANAEVAQPAASQAAGIAVQVRPMPNILAVANQAPIYDPALQELSVKFKCPNAIGVANPVQAGSFDPSVFCRTGVGANEFDAVLFTSADATKPSDILVTATAANYDPYADATQLMKCGFNTYGLDPFTTMLDLGKWLDGQVEKDCDANREVHFAFDRVVANGALVEAEFTLKIKPVQAGEAVKLWFYHYNNGPEPRFGNTGHFVHSVTAPAQ